MRSKYIFPLIHKDKWHCILKKNFSHKLDLLADYRFIARTNLRKTDLDVLLLGIFIFRMRYNEIQHSFGLAIHG